MKKINYYFLTLLLSLAFLLYSCGNGEKATEKTTTETEVVGDVAVNETQILVDYLEANGNFINSKKVPAMIKSKEVHENLDNPNYLVVDIRAAKDYNNGHIAGADNIKMKELIIYFENDILATDYEKISIVCYSGQSASYSTSVLRLLGYDNVYAMKWGMASWNMPFGDKWLSHLGNDYTDKLVTDASPKAAASSLPTLTTGQSSAKAILKIRAKEALNTKFKTTLVKTPELFDNGSAYYINNYWPTAKYEAGHIPGAIQYQPKKSLDSKVDLLTLPTDQKIVTYCFTGQHSAFVTAYLRVLGYDAYSLSFGANTFMNSVMQENGEGWNAFTKKAIHDFDIVVEEVEEAIADDGEEEGGCS